MNDDARGERSRESREDEEARALDALDAGDGHVPSNDPVRHQIIPIARRYHGDGLEKLQARVEMERGLHKVWKGRGARPSP